VMPVADTQPVYVLTQHAIRAPPHVSQHCSHTSCLNLLSATPMTPLICCYINSF